MTGLLFSLIDQLWPIIAMAGTALVALFLVFLKGKSAGKQAERDKVAKQEQKARDTASKIDRSIAANDPGANRKELGEWSGKP